VREDCGLIHGYGGLEKMYLKKSWQMHIPQPQTNRIICESSGYVYIWFEVRDLRLHSMMQ